MSDEKPEPSIDYRARCRCGHSRASHAVDLTLVQSGPALNKGWCVVCGCHEFDEASAQRDR